MFFVLLISQGDIQSVINHKGLTSYLIVANVFWKEVKIAYAHLNYSFNTYIICIYLVLTFHFIALKLTKHRIESVDKFFFPVEFEQLFISVWYFKNEEDVSCVHTGNLSYSIEKLPLKVDDAVQRSIQRIQIRISVRSQISLLCFFYGNPERKRKKISMWKTSAA